MILGITYNSCPKFNVYLVSKTCLLISLRISCKVFSIVTYSEMIGCWFTSLVQLCTTNWLVVGLLGNPAQLLCNEPSLIVASCFLTPLCCNCLIVSIKKSRRCFFYCHSSTLLILTNSLSLNTYCFNCWLRVVITSITLTSTLLDLGDLTTIMAL